MRIADFGYPLSSLLTLFFPDRCRLCGELLAELTRTPVCRACWEAARDQPAAGRCSICGLAIAGDLAAAPDFRCGDCVLHPPAFERARNCGPYRGALRKLVHFFKFQGMTPLARPLGAWMARAAVAEEMAGCDAVMALPLDPARLRSRGYNQAELLAREVARRLGRPLLRGACRRVRATAPQAGLTRAQRQENVRGAFAAEEKLVAGRTLLLVDDVMTTGATLNACARALRHAGAAGVMALTLARTTEELACSS